MSEVSLESWLVMWLPTLLFLTSARMSAFHVVFLLVGCCQPSVLFWGDKCLVDFVLLRDAWVTLSMNSVLPAGSNYFGLSTCTPALCSPCADSSPAGLWEFPAPLCPPKRTFISFCAAYQSHCLHFYIHILIMKLERKWNFLFHWKLALTSQLCLSLLSHACLFAKDFASRPL